jgi:hypothetical protein
MTMQWRQLFLLGAMTAMAVAPAAGQTSAPAAGHAGSGTHAAASIPDFSGVWRRSGLPWFEPPVAENDFFIWHIIGRAVAWRGCDVIRLASSFRSVVGPTHPRRPPLPAILARVYVAHRATRAQNRYI